MFIAFAITSCRPLGDDLLSYGQNDDQAFAASKASFAGEFATFWLAMNENYCIWDYEAEFGLDWDEVYDTYLPQFQALDERQTPVSDDELKALYCQFLDSIHDGHCAFQIKNRHTGHYIVVDWPAVCRWGLRCWGKRRKTYWGTETTAPHSGEIRSAARPP